MRRAKHLLTTSAALLCLLLTTVRAPAQPAPVPLPSTAPAPATGPTTVGATGKIPHVEVDVKSRTVRVECEMLGVEAPLEFFCVEAGTSEHEAVLRSKAKGSHLHLALLMIGLEPGTPLTYSEAAKKWLPPHGPPLHIDVEWQTAEGKVQRVPAHRWMRDVKDRKGMPPVTWVFVGSRVMEDGNYAADVTGYLVSLVNFDLTVIDIPQLASSANATLQWERNPEATPPPGTKVTMVITPAGKGDAPATKAAEPRPMDAGGPQSNAAPAGATERPDGALSGVAVNEVMVGALRKRWDSAVNPHRNELRLASQTHYDVITALRREQQRIIDEADKVQRLIDELEKEYQDMTTPRPAPIE